MSDDNARARREADEAWWAFQQNAAHDPDAVQTALNAVDATIADYVVVLGTLTVAENTIDALAVERDHWRDLAMHAAQVLDTALDGPLFVDGCAACEALKRAIA